jgi:hypothetical protein
MSMAILKLETIVSSFNIAIDTPKEIPEIVLNVPQNLPVL